MIKSIEILSVPVTDQQNAKAFYLKLGFEIIVEAPMGPEQTWLQMGLPGAATSITLVNWFPKMPAGSLQGVVLGTADIAAEIQLLESKGITVSAIDKTPWGKFAQLADPDGNGWTLHEE